MLRHTLCSVHVLQWRESYFELGQREGRQAGSRQARQHHEDQRRWAREKGERLKKQGWLTETPNTQICRHGTYLGTYLGT